MSENQKGYIGLLIVLTIVYALAAMWVFDGAKLEVEDKCKICFIYFFIVFMPTTFFYWVIKERK